MIKKTYLFFHHFTFFTLAISIALIFLLTQHYLVTYLAQKYLKEYGIGYSNIQGTLFYGVVLNDVRYQDIVSIKEVQIQYNLLSLFRPTSKNELVLNDVRYQDILGIKKVQIQYNLLSLFRQTPKIGTIKVNSLYLDVSKIPSSDANASTTSIMPFVISNIELNNAKVIAEKETLKFNFKAKELHYHDTIDINTLLLDFKSSYANGSINATVASNKLRGNASVQIDDSISKEYLSFLTPIPKLLQAKLEATTQKISLSTYLEVLTLSADTNLSINDADVNLTYSIGNNSLEANLKYKASYLAFETLINETFLLTTDNYYSSKLDATITKQPIELPFKNVHAEFFGDAKSIQADIKAGVFNLNLSSKDYNYFAIHGQCKNLSLSFLDSIPEQFKNDIVSLKADIGMQIAPFFLKGKVHAKDNYFKTDTEFELQKNYELYKAILYPQLTNELYKNYPVELFSPLKIIYKNNGEGEKLKLDANVFHATLLKKENSLEGFGTVASSNFTLSGHIDKESESKIKILTKIPSMKKLLSELKLHSQTDKTVHDGEVELKTTLNFGKNLSIQNDISIPWYSVTLDPETTYFVEDIFLSTTYTNKYLTLHRYTAKYNNQKFYSDKASTIFMDANENIVIKEFWLYDSLHATGLIETTKKEVAVDIKSDRFNYQNKDGNVSAKVDLSVGINSLGKQTIEGTITLIDGMITFVPPQDYTVTDKDIIVIQDIKSVDDSNRFINININSLKPITYKTKEIHIKFTPDIVIYQEPSMPLKLLGMATIEEGKITNGEKEFVFDKSEIYFVGDNPINPQLNLNLHYYTLDYIDIEIFITNTMNSPVIIFSSKPAMSQNDIMSYILFGEPASSLFESSDGASKASLSSLLLGTGLKQIFNDTTGIKVDTLNILTNKEGTLGYEIGTRFNKNIRIVYKNDTASSVILQYSLSKSIRIDVDIAQAGQGVNIIYVKDF